jgi:acetylornithine/N-succinyldiaminopimelate aminotransferase
VLEEDRLVEGAAKKGEHLAKGLEKLCAKHPKKLTGHRGLGLLQGAILAKGIDGRTALAKLRDHGVLLTVAGADALRFSPPLIVTEAELDEGLARVSAALAEIAAP